MPAKDMYHKAVKQALIKDGRVVTNDPLHLRCCDFIRLLICRILR